MCPFKFATGLPCPGCGGTRAVVALTEGRVWDALCLNPLSVLVVLWGVISVVWIVARGWDSWRGFWGRRWPLWLTITVLAIVALNWAWNIYKGL